MSVYFLFACFFLQVSEASMTIFMYGLQSTSSVLFVSFSIGVCGKLWLDTLTGCSVMFIPKE